MLRSDTLRITPEILALIARLDEFKGAWRAQGALAPERLSALQRVATIESIGSSTRIEGSRLSDREVERLLARLDARAYQSRDEQEVAGYADTLARIHASWPDIALTENHIRQLHRDLLVYSDKDAWHRGQYKTTPNHVAAFDADGKEIGIVFETATPFDTPRRMAELLEWFHAEREAALLHPLLRIAIWTVVFLEIHPFQDGNGRLSRALTTLLLLQAGYTYVPFSSLEAVIEKEREAYYLALRRTQASLREAAPDWQPWVEFFLRALAAQARGLEKKIERERIVLAALPALALQVVEFAREHGRVTMGDAIRLTGASRNTLKLHFRALVERGMLRARGKGRGAWYEIA